MKAAILAAGVAALLATPAAARSGSGASDQAQSSGQIDVLSAREIVDESVRDRQGNELGEVEYLMVGVTDGRVRYLIVEPEAGDDEQYVPVPWQAVKFTRSDGEEELIVDSAQFGKQQRYSDEQIADLTQPAVITSIYQLWAPVAAETEGKAQAGQQQQQQQQAGKSGAAEGTPHFLVGREVVTTVVPPAFTTSRELRGSQVYSTDNTEFGEIDNLVIDRQRGRIAFVQVTRGGFLGLGEQVTPVPFEALSYDHQANAYRLNKPASELKNVQSFSAGKAPTTIKVSDLSALYKEYGVKPYW